MDQTLLGLLAGNYECTYTGSSSGVAKLTISNGVISGVYSTNSTNQNWLTGSVGASGNAEINGVSGGSCGSSATFSGSFRRDGTGSGTWSDVPSRGTWSCKAGGSGSNGLGSCGGGGGGGSPNLSFPIQAARINEITTPLTTVGSYSGTVEGYAASGSVTLSTSALSTAVFEGVNRSAKSTTQSGTISYNGNSIPTNSTSINY
jgi:hypothetical protein